MTALSRRRFAAQAGLAAIGAAFPLRYAKAAEFSFKWGTNVPETHPLNVYGRKAAEEVSQATDGRFELRVFPNNQLGGDTDMFSQLRTGALECSHGDWKCQGGWSALCSIASQLFVPTVETL